MTVKSRRAFQFFNTWVAATTTVFPLRVKVLNLSIHTTHVVASFRYPSRVLELSVWQLIPVILAIRAKCLRLPICNFVLLSHNSVLLGSELRLNFLKDCLRCELISRCGRLGLHLSLCPLLGKCRINLEYIDFFFLASRGSLFVFILVKPISCVVVWLWMFTFLRHYSNLIIN
jgi:hypothetical protein